MKKQQQQQQSESGYGRPRACSDESESASPGAMVDGTRRSRVNSDTMTMEDTTRASAEAHTNRRASHPTDCVESPLQNRVVARSANYGTAFYLFNHQAGGHKPLLRSALGDVCKPAIPLELKFYKSLETQFPQLKPFVPTFVGVISVDLVPSTLLDAPSELSSQQDANLTAASACTLSPNAIKDKPSSPNSSINSSNTSNGNASGGGKKRRLSTNVHGSSSSASYSVKLWKKERMRAEARSITHSPPTTTNANDVINSVASSLQTDYLVLTDLTRKYVRPCVLDIKMGTRQHGEDASPAKAQSHTAKCLATTSHSLGLRLCGMQIYDDVESRYTLWDKLWGRALKEYDIEPALKTYLSIDGTVRWDALESLLTKVLQLKGVVESTRGVRFWGASLLLIYEGDLKRAVPRQDVHLIDFAHCQQSTQITTPDEGLLLGLSNLANFLANLLAAKAN